MTDESKVLETVTRGFAGIHDQLRERDGRVSALSDKIIGMEFQLNQACATLSKMEGKIAESETIKLEMRVQQLEEHAKDAKTKQADNAKWIKGLLASVIMLLLGFLFNFIRLSFR